MMPTLALVGLASWRWLPPLPVPLFVLWPLVLFCLGMAKLIERERPAHAQALRTAMEAFRELRGLAIDVDTVDHRKVQIWFV